MKYCSQCGERLEDGDIFCPGCGSRQQEATPAEAQAPAAVTESAPAQNEPDHPAFDTNTPGEGAPAVVGEAPVIPKTKKKKTGLIIGLVAAALVVLGIAALFVTGAYASLLPHSKLKLGLAENKLIKSVMNGEIVDRDLPKAVDFSLTADVITNDDIDYYTEEIVDILKQCSVSGTIDTIDGYGAALKLDYKGNTALDVRLLANEQEIGVYLSPASDDYYTIATDKLFSKLFPDEDPEKYKDLFNTPEGELLKDDVNRVLEIIGKSLDHADIDIQKNVPVTLFEDEIHKGAVYTVPLTKALVQEVLYNVINYLESDECYLTKYIEEGAFYSGMIDSYGYDTEQSFRDLLKEARDNVDETAQDIADENLKFEVVMEGNDIIRQRIYNDEGCFAYDSVKKGNTERTSFYMQSDGDDTFRLNWNAVSQGKGRVVKCDLYSDDEKIMDFDCDVNLGSVSQAGLYVGDYKVTIYNDWDDSVNVIKMNVAAQDGGYMHTVTYDTDEDTAYYYGVDSVRVKLFTANGERVAPPSGVDRVDISDYSDSKLTRLLSSLAMKLSSELEDLFY